ncbi:MAG: FAD-dependent oxidoreductase, partial [Ramlibacter sp.]
MTQEEILAQFGPREAMEYDVVVVGAGPAGLATAIRLKQLAAQDNREVSVVVLEKGSEPGAHILSGAIVDPIALNELIPDWKARGAPLNVPVTEDIFLFLNETGATRTPNWLLPKNFHNEGNYVASLANLVRWLAQQAEEAGAYILTETSATELLVEDGVVRGVRSGDKGRGKEGEELPNFEPGSDVVAQATVLAEGVWGHLTGAAIREYELAEGREPQVWSLGVKEVWEVPKPLDRVIHTLGWPLRYGAKWKEFGGSWIYPMGDDKVSIGFVVGLDYTDATLSGHDLLQQFKTSRLVRRILEGGKRVSWGAKAIPEGGYWAMPKLTAPGMVIAGDA